MGRELVRGRGGDANTIPAPPAYKLPGYDKRKWIQILRAVGCIRKLRVKKSGWFEGCAAGYWEQKTYRIKCSLIKKLRIERNLMYVDR